MPDFSKVAARANCPFCKQTSDLFANPFEETENFYIICDTYALREGHILIIPKAHFSCIAEYTPEVHKEFLALNHKVAGFVRTTYGSIATFEHGKFGQTVFHSHIHYLPFTGQAEDIISEGTNALQPLAKFSDLQSIFERDRGYLYFAIGDKKWTVDPKLTTPRFFRDRFARALGVPERGNWEAMHKNPKFMHRVRAYNQITRAKWEKFAQAS